MKYKLSVLIFCSLLFYMSYQNFEDDFSSLKKTSVESDFLGDLDFSSHSLDSTFRDPFASYLYKKKIVKRIKSKKKEVIQETPSFSISSILWGGNPVAILSNNGQTKVSKKGDVVWGWSIIKINRDSVLLSKNGQKFTLQ